jgi:hypothetical protein
VIRRTFGTGTRTYIPVLPIASSELSTIRRRNKKERKEVMTPTEPTNCTIQRLKRQKRRGHYVRQFLCRDDREYRAIDSSQSAGQSADSRRRETADASLCSSHILCRIFPSQSG